MPSPYIGSIHFAIPLVGSANETRPSFLNDCRRFWLLEALPPEVKVLYRRIGVEWESVLHSNLMLGVLGAGRRKNQGTKGPMVFLCHKMVSSRKWRMVGIHGLVQKITCTPRWWNNHHIKSLVNCAEIGYSLTFQLPAVIGNFVRLTLEVCSWFYSPAVYAACTYCCMFGYTIGYSTCI